MHADTGVSSYYSMAPSKTSVGLGVAVHSTCSETTLVKGLGRISLVND